MAQRMARLQQERREQDAEIERVGREQQRLAQKKADAIVRKQKAADAVEEARKLERERILKAPRQCGVRKERHCPLALGACDLWRRLHTRRPFVERVTVKVAHA